MKLKNCIRNAKNQIMIFFKGYEMTKEKLDRIKKAYSSGLKVQIWFNGYWEDFDIRDYSMYSEPFSENRQYRIIGSDYADIAEKRIADLEEENAELKQQVEKMKCCGNCKHLKHIGDCICGYYTCDKDGENEGMFYPKCNNKDKWELKND